jgi:tRNA A37 methylthiotransferase MiaB
MTIEISFADLSHTGKTVDANFFPLGSGFVAAYAQEYLGDEIDVQLFKYPTDFADYLDKTIPRIACFANYSWNLNLNYEFARRLKERHPGVVIVFGGPNYPVEEDGDEQEMFLRQHPAIDLYVDGEGEEAFTELYKILAGFNFDVGEFKAQETHAPNTHYVLREKFIRGPGLPRIKDINTIPSPFLNGMMDKFFDDTLTPLMQSHRGCPYSCAFCHDGIKYMSKVGRFTQERINAEILYINERSILPDLCFADLNFGIYKEDLDTARLLASLQKKHGWPKVVQSSPAKNNKDRLVEISRILDGFLVSASVQHTDTEVLANIKRSNISLGQLADMARETAEGKTGSYSEVILCLPGDTIEKHKKSVFDMLDLGLNEMRMYQFILLAGSEGASKEYRNKFEYDIRYRVLPRCFGNYQVLGEDFTTFEFHEVCVGNSTLSYEDYIQCRRFNLMVEIFNNGGIFEELLMLLDREGIVRSAFFKKLDESVYSNEALAHIFRDYREDEDRNFWSSKEELEGFLKTPEAIEKYLSGEYGANQIMQFRSLAFIEHMDDVSAAAFAIARELLDEVGAVHEQMDDYLGELAQYIKLKKSDLLSLEQSVQRTFHYDFVKLSGMRFKEDPFDFSVPDGLDISFNYSDKQFQDISAYFQQYGRTISGLGHFMQRAYLASLYREVHYI